MVSNNEFRLRVSGIILNRYFVVVSLLNVSMIKIKSTLPCLVSY